MVSRVINSLIFNGVGMEVSHNEVVLTVTHHLDDVYINKAY